MKNLEFDLAGHEYIQLNNLLKVLHVVGTGGEANIRIDNGELRVNGETETQKRKKLRTGDIVHFENMIILVR